MISRRLVLCVVLMLAMFMGAGCLDYLRYSGPCQRPQNVIQPEVVGVWQAHYRNYKNPGSPSSRIIGVETLTIHADGTYSQLLESAESRIPDQIRGEQ